MPLNSLYPRGTLPEQNMMEALIIESLRAIGQEFYYIPRTLVAKDEIFGEDSLSKFKSAYMIEGYLDNIDSFGGASNFMSKFGMYIEEQGTVTIARARWEQLIGQFGSTIIPTRPCEGDLLWFPLTSGLFEIKFVEHQNPFYQIGKLFTYKLKIESFQYSSERIETDLDELNRMALDMTFDIKGKTITDDSLVDVGLEDGSSLSREDTDPTHRKYGINTDFIKESEGVLNFDESNPFGE